MGRKFFLQDYITNFDAATDSTYKKQEKGKRKQIYATTATSRPAKTPMAKPLTLFLSAALVSVEVGVEVLDEEVLDDSEEVPDSDEEVPDGEVLDGDSLDEVDSELLVLRSKNIEIKGQVVTMKRLTPSW